MVCIVCWYVRRWLHALITLFHFPNESECWLHKRHGGMAGCWLDSAHVEFDVAAKVTHALATVVVACAVVAVAAAAAATERCSQSSAPFARLIFKAGRRRRRIGVDVLLLSFSHLSHTQNTRKLEALLRALYPTLYANVCRGERHAPGGKGGFICARGILSLSLRGAPLLPASLLSSMSETRKSTRICSRTTTYNYYNVENSTVILASTYGCLNVRACLCSRIAHLAAHRQCIDYEQQWPHCADYEQQFHSAHS